MDTPSSNMTLEQFLKLFAEEHRAMPVRESGRLWAELMVKNLRERTADKPDSPIPAK